MSEPIRGEVWLLDLGELVGHEQGWRRPALVISADRWNRHAQTVVVVPLTRTSHDLPTRVELEPTAENGLHENSYARCEDVRSVSAARLVRRLGRVDVVGLAAVGRVLRIFLEI